MFCQFFLCPPFNSPYPYLYLCAGRGVRYHQRCTLADSELGEQNGGGGDEYECTAEEDTERRGGWRKSQIFLDLCSKFENKNREEEMEVEDKSVRVVHRCENPPSFGGVREKLQNSDNYTFSSLRASWDTHVPRKSIWKQQKINGFSLVTRPANQKRGGSEDKVLAGKRLKQC